MQHLDEMNKLMNYILKNEETNKEYNEKFQLIESSYSESKSDVGEPLKLDFGSSTHPLNSQPDNKSSLMSPEQAKDPIQ